MFPLPTMYLSPTPVLQFFDNNGKPLVGGLLFVYAAGTTTKQAAFTDASGLTQLPNPIILNARGEVAPSATGTSCGLWLDPTLAYKYVLAPATDTDPPTNPIWPGVDNIVSAASAVLAQLAAFQATLGGVQIGSLQAYAGSTAPSGWLFCYGQAVSRSTYSALFSAIGTAYGAGDSSTTFNLPDLRGRLPLGKDDMGGSAANRVTNGVSGVNAIVLGATGGDEHAQQDTLNASSSVSIGISDPGHSHVLTSYHANQSNTAPAYPVSTDSAAPTGTTTAAIASAFTGISASAAVTTTVTSALAGASQNVAPVQVVNYVIFTGIFS